MEIDKTTYNLSESNFPSWTVQGFPALDYMLYGLASDSNLILDYYLGSDGSKYLGSRGYYPQPRQRWCPPPTKTTNPGDPVGGWLQQGQNHTAEDDHRRRWSLRGKDEKGQKESGRYNQPSFFKFSSMQNNIRFLREVE